MLSTPHDKHIDLDQRGNAQMTPRTLAYFYQKQGTPDTFNLSYKGFLEINASLSAYAGLTTLHLTNNAIYSIQYLPPLLLSLYLDHNTISDLHSLPPLFHLCSLSLSYNCIQHVPPLPLPALTTLNLTHNFLHSVESIAHIQCLPTLTSLALSHNDLAVTDEMIVAIGCNQGLIRLSLKDTPLATQMQKYRKKIVYALKSLEVLDQRKVTSQEHRIAQAWAEGTEELIKSLIKEEHNSTIINHTHPHTHTHPHAHTNHNIMIVSEAIERSSERDSERGSKKGSERDSERGIERGSERDSERDSERGIERDSERGSEVEKDDDLEETSHKYIKKHVVVQEKAFYQEELDQDTMVKRIKEVLGKQESQYSQYLSLHLTNKWKDKYTPLLQALLIKYKFDFEEVQPSFNMILKEIAKQLNQPFIRFEIKQLQLAWTAIEKKRRNI